MAPDHASEQPGDREPVQPARLPVSLSRRKDQGEVARPPVRLVGASQRLQEAINASEQISAQWRKAMNEYAQRTVELLSPKN